MSRHVWVMYDRVQGENRVSLLKTLIVAISYRPASKTPNVCTNERSCLDSIFTLSLCDDGDGKSAVRRVADQLLLPPGADKVARRTDEDEPARDHEDVAQPLVEAAQTAGAAAASDRVGVKVVLVGIWWDTTDRIRVASSAIRCAVLHLRATHRKAIVEQGDAEAGAGAVLGGVGVVEKVCEEETNKLEGHADESIPDEREEGADDQTVDKDVIRAVASGSKDGGFPVGGSGVGGGLFVGLGWISDGTTVGGQGTYGWLLLEVFVS